MILRPYQQKALTLTRQSIQSGHKAPLIVIPTGGGKTAVGVAIASGVVHKSGTALWLAHRTELIGQAAEELAAAGLSVGAISASSDVRPNPYAPVQIGQIQTISNRDTSGLSPRVIIIDESHRAIAAEYSELLKRWPDAIRVGLTATPERSDGQAMGGEFDDLIVPTSIRELTELKVLVPCEVIRPKRQLNSNEIAQSPVDAYLQHTPGEKAVVFSPHVIAAEQHLAGFLAASIPVALVTGEDSAGDRKRIMADYAAGRIRVLVNVYVAVEGWNDPPTSVCILARGCGHAGMYLQCVGRILRSFPGKTRAVLIDLRGVSYTHGHPSDDREYFLEGKAIREKDEVIPGSVCGICGGETIDGRCQLCGTMKEPMEAPTVTNDPLVKYEWIRAETGDKKEARYRKWLAEAEAKGHKKGAAAWKYKSVYGHWPGKRSA